VTRQASVNFYYRCLSLSSARRPWGRSRCCASLQTDAWPPGASADCLACGPSFRAATSQERSIVPLLRAAETCSLLPVRSELETKLQIPGRMAGIMPVCYNRRRRWSWCQPTMSVPCCSRSPQPSIGSKHPSLAANGCASFLRVWLVVTKNGLCDWNPPISSPSSQSFFRLCVLMDPQPCLKSSGRIRNPRTSTKRCASGTATQ
jgi:hypothetical protein